MRPTEPLQGQGNLFTDILMPSGEALAREGMNRAAENADRDWLSLAKRVLWQLIGSGEEFTTDLLWARLEQQGVATHEPRALGSTVRAALRNGFMTEVRMVRSQRPECHARRIPVYVGTGKKAEAA